MNDAPSQGGQAGFTIVETLIVLAVTGFMLTVAVLMILGQQNKVQFTQSIQEIRSAIQQSINEVSAGYYPNPGNLNCSGAAGALIITQGNRTQGSNTGCIFLGKAVQFGVQGTDPQQYVVHSIAGRQDNGGILKDAVPTAIAPGETKNPDPAFPNASRAGKLLYGLEAVSMDYIIGGTRRSIGAVAFVSGLGTYQNSQLVSGTQQISLIPVGDSSTGNSPLRTIPEKVVDAININLANPAVSPPNPDGGVEICFASGGTDQSGLISIGSNGRILLVKLAIKSTRDCT